MRVRHSGLRSVLLGAFLASSGCAASGSGDLVHGPSFDIAAGDAMASSDAADAAAPFDGNAPDSRAPADAGQDAPADVDAGFDAGGCTDKTAVVAGNGTSLYEAIAIGRGAFANASVGSPASSAPALVPVGGGFLTAVRTTNDALEWSVASGASWSPLDQIGQATTVASPALAILGADVHAVYLGSNGKYYHGTYKAGAWDAASDPVGGPGASQSFGPTSVAVAATGSDLLIVHRAGTSAQLYAERWSGGAWSAAPVAGAQAASLAPSVVAMLGGASDAMIAYLHDGDSKVSWATRAGGTWTDHGAIDATFFSNSPVALAPLGSGRAVLVFEGTDAKAYATVFDGTTWSKPATPLAASGTLGGPPAIAPGACGDDAVVALPMTGGDASIVRFASGGWSAPTTLTGVSNATSIAVATAK